MLASSCSSTLILLSIRLILSVTRGVEAASVGGGSGNERMFDCSDAQLSKCVSPDNINKLRLISDEEELDSLCGANINERLRCIDNYTRNCMDTDQRSHFNKIYSESTMVIQEICSDGGEYRKEFLKHSPCLKSNQAAHEACATSYSKSLEEIKSSAKSGAAADSHIKTLCCSLQEYMRCSKHTVTKACGEQTATFAWAFLNRMVSGLLQNHCQNHNIQDGQCSADSKDSNSTSPLYASPKLFIILSLLISYITFNF